MPAVEIHRMLVQGAARGRRQIAAPTRGAVEYFADLPATNNAV